MNNSLYLIDGHAVMYRYHNAFKDNPMRTREGIITSAPYGMAKLIATLMKNYPMTHIAVIFDPPHKTWRKDFYPEYKGNRDKDRDDISYQIELTYSLVNSWGIYCGAFVPLEADDVIGILAKRAAGLGWDVRIASKDKDFMQMVDDRIKMLDLGKTIGVDEATIIDREAVFAKFGVWPEQIIDYLSMLGDASDNVAGLEGVGKKTAADFLSEYKTWEGVFEAAKAFTPTKGKNKVKSLFSEKKAQTVLAADDIMKRNRKLIRLAFEYGIPTQLDECIKPPLHNARLFEQLEQLEMHSIVRQLSE